MTKIADAEDWGGSISWSGSGFIIAIWCPVAPFETVVCSHCYLGVSINGGSPKSSILIEFSMINHPYWGTTILGNPHLGKMTTLTYFDWWKNLVSEPTLKPPSRKIHSSLLLSWVGSGKECFGGENIRTKWHENFEGWSEERSHVWFGYILDIGSPSCWFVHYPTKTRPRKGNRSSEIHGEDQDLPPWISLKLVKWWLANCPWDIFGLSLIRVVL